MCLDVRWSTPKSSLRFWRWSSRKQEPRSRPKGHTPGAIPSPRSKTQKPITGRLFQCWWSNVVRWFTYHFNGDVPLQTVTIQYVPLFFTEFGDLYIYTYIILFIEIAILVELITRWYTLISPTKHLFKDAKRLRTPWVHGTHRPGQRHGSGNDPLLSQRSQRLRTGKSPCFKGI